MEVNNRVGVQYCELPLYLNPKHEIRNAIGVMLNSVQHLVLSRGLDPEIEDPDPETGSR